MARISNGHNVRMIAAALAAFMSSPLLPLKASAGQYGDGNSEKPTLTYGKVTVTGPDGKVIEDEKIKGKALQQLKDSLIQLPQAFGGNRMAASKNATGQNSDAGDNGDKSTAQPSDAGEAQSNTDGRTQSRSSGGAKSRSHGSNVANCRQSYSNNNSFMICSQQSDGQNKPIDAPNLSQGLTSAAVHAAGAF